MVTRVTNLAANRLVQSMVLKTQDQINDAQLQLSSQQNSQDYRGIAGEANRLVNVEASSRRVDQFIRDNSFINMRIETMLNSMDFVKEALVDIRKIVRDFLEEGVITDGLDKDEISQLKMDEIQSFLNVKMNGRFVFAGAKTDTKPVEAGDLSSAPRFISNVTTAEPDFYYKGDDTQIKARIDEGVTLDYGVSANDEGFEKLIRAIRVVRSTDLTDADANSKFQHALDLLMQSEDQIQAAELRTGLKFQQLDKTTRNLKDSKAILDGISSEIERADTFKVVSELNQSQTQLEASFSTVVRVNSLSLAKFLIR